MRLALEPMIFCRQASNSAMTSPAVAAANRADGAALHENTKRAA